MFAVVSHCRPACTRRDFLRVGSLGISGLAASAAASRASNPPLPPNSAPRAKAVILVYLGGGLSQIDSFDPKPDAPAEVRGAYRSIPTAVPSLRVGERLPLLARVMDRVTLVRSGSHDCDHHETAGNWVLSGRFGSPFGDHPAVGAVVAHETGFRGSVPPYVAVPRSPSGTWELGKAAFLGERCESVKTGDPNSANSREPEKLRDRYGRTTTGQSLLLARRLVETGARFVTVNYPGWDHHGRIFEALDRKLPEFDRGLSALIEDLDGRGMLDETLLVVLSEFGRTPRVNTDGGRDHWGPAGSILLAGAGVRCGCVVGATDRHGAYPTEQPVGPADVAFTILTALGIDPRKTLTTPDGRPIPILDRGDAIKELFG